MLEMNKKPGDTVPSLISAAHYGTIGVSANKGVRAQGVRRGLKRAYSTTVLSHCQQLLKAAGR